MTAAVNAVDLSVFHQEVPEGHHSQSGFSSMHPIPLQPRSHPLLSQFKEEKQSTNKHCQEKIQSVFNNPCKSLLVSSLPCKLSEWETSVLILSIAVARLACGQQRERLMQVSSSQGHPGFSPPPLHFHSVFCCYPSYTAGKQTHRDLLIIIVTSLFVVLARSFSRSPTPELKLVCAWSARALMINGEKG